MDYYRILKVAPDASTKEIEQAYQRLVKESRYNASIDKQQIEAAYRVLGNEKAKTIYDRKQSLTSQTQENREKRIRKQKKRNISLEDKLTRPRLVKILLVLILVAGIFYFYRFGYRLKSYEVGDVLYLKTTDQRYGTIIQIQERHDFLTAKVDAYLVETPEKHRIWIPQTDAKVRCYTAD